jgi:hypothetical protein
MKTLRLICLLIASAALSACGQGYSTGSRMGVVTKFSNKGLVMKSWEGEMNLGGFRNKTNSNGESLVVANVFVFSVTSPDIAKQINEAMISGARVELVYNQWFLPPLSQDSGYTITAVKPTL